MFGPGRRMSRRTARRTSRRVSRRQAAVQEPQAAPQAAAPQPAAAPPEEDYTDELKKLADLQVKGIITNEDFQAKKKQLLGL